MQKDSKFCDNATGTNWDSIKDSPDIEVKEKYGCECLANLMNTYFLDPDLSSDWYVYVLIVLTMLFELVTFYYIYNYKGLQAHPMKLFMWISFGTFSYFWLILW